MQHRYVLIGGEMAGHNYQGTEPRHTPDGFLSLARPSDVHAFMMSDAAPQDCEIAQFDYVIVATEAYHDGKEELGIYYAIPATSSPSDALIMLCRQANRLQNFACDIQQQYEHQTGGRVPETLAKYGLKFNLI